MDDIAITPGVCDRPGDCTFNTGKVGLCEWKQVISESIKMQWINRMPTTGPLASSNLQSKTFYEKVIFHGFWFCRCVHFF